MAWAAGRLPSATYPINTRKLIYNYASELNDDISRLSSLSDNSTTTFESYDYLGPGTVVRRGHPESSVDLTYIISQSGGSGDAGDKYAALGRFGRVVDQLWLSSSTTTDRFKYGYDPDNNRLSAITWSTRRSACCTTLTAPAARTII